MLIKRDEMAQRPAARGARRPWQMGRPPKRAYHPWTKNAYYPFRWSFKQHPIMIKIIMGCCLN